MITLKYRGLLPAFWIIYRRIRKDMDLFMMRNVLVIVEAFTMYAKRSLRRLPAKHRLTDIGKIPAHAAQPDIYGAV